MIACDGSATSAATYQSDTVLDSAEDPQPATRRQVARELVPEVRARDGREGDVARGYKSDYFVGADQDIQTAIILLERADNWNTNKLM